MFATLCSSCRKERNHYFNQNHRKSAPSKVYLTEKRHLLTEIAFQGGEGRERFLLVGYLQRPGGSTGNSKLPFRVNGLLGNACDEEKP